MKKLNNKLQLNKKTLASLDDQAMAQLKGGMMWPDMDHTYSLSMGDLCRYSQMMGVPTREGCINSL
ncbi:class I lanthipeptide [Hymenobacter persicinus]|uniref:Uncharacterized protein n=1 Tax=Hymenobacter persicinus TaxID=2025506 RepID=A0A4Q5LG39_9BACT|nr:class I lanthipeptide [Hymenobacter persicinus]RYU82786.1 hypothetical protein EWM57_03600 [Hymenobacter persicinus]